jgi:hemolysin activation/secretion protein
VTKVIYQINSFTRYFYINKLMKIKHFIFLLLILFCTAPTALANSKNELISENISPVCLTPEESLNISASEQPRIRKIVILLSEQQKKLISDDEVRDIFIKQLKFENCPATPERLDVIKDAITLLYIKKGYITSRAKLPKIDATGTVTVSIVEGRIREVFVTDYKENYIDNSITDYIKSRVQRGLGTPFNIKQLEEQIKLLEIDPIFDEDDPLCKKSQLLDSQTLCAQKNIDTILTLRRPGEQNETSSLQEWESNLIIKVKRTRYFRANFSFDNSSPPSVGAERLRADLSFASLTKAGDIIVASFQAAPLHFSAENGFNTVSLGYQIPLSPKNNTFQVRFDNRRERIVQKPFDEFQLRAKSELYELTYRQPLVRSYSNEFALSLGFAYQNGQTFVFNDTPFPFGIGADQDGVSRTSVIKFAQDYTHRGNSGTWVLRSQFSFGTGLFNATDNPNSIPDGIFFSWLGQVQWLQQLGSDNLLIMQTDLQLTPDSLLPSQQFVIGGSQLLRGYRQNVKFGDNGFRFSLENRITLQRDEARKPTLQIAPFFDMGAVWNQAENPNKLIGNNFLAGAGLGVLWQPFSQLNMRLDYAIPLVDLRSEGDNLQDKGLYFSINYKL